MEQVKNTRNSICDEICLETCVLEYSDIRLMNLLAKQNITKEKLALWLESVCFILDQYAIPCLDKAALLSYEVESLKNEKISDQRRIISLQGQLIEKHDSTMLSQSNV